MVVFLLKHNHYLSSNVCDSKLLGVFSSLNVCNSAIGEYKYKSGFCEQPNNFEISEFSVMKKKSPLTPVKVFVVQHEYEDSKNYEYVKLIGIFASPKTAKREIAKMKKKPPFNRNPLGFSVDDYPLDKMYWIDGYDTWDTEYLTKEQL